MHLTIQKHKLTYDTVYAKNELINKWNHLHSFIYDKFWYQYFSLHIVNLQWEQGAIFHWPDKSITNIVSSLGCTGVCKDWKKLEVHSQEIETEININKWRHNFSIIWCLFQLGSLVGSSILSVVSRWHIGLFDSSYFSQVTCTKVTPPSVQP